MSISEKNVHDISTVHGVDKNDRILLISKSVSSDQTPGLHLVFVIVYK